jgi:hypothetical protein
MMTTKRIVLVREGAEDTVKHTMQWFGLDSPSFRISQPQCNGVKVGIVQC